MTAIEPTSLAAHAATPEASIAQQLQWAQSRNVYSRSEAWTALNSLFRTGQPPGLPLYGSYKGEMIALDVAPGLTQLADSIATHWMPWLGKQFDPVRQRGDNLFSNTSLPLTRLFWPFYRGVVGEGGERYHAFRFRTYIAPGKFDPDRQVLKIDYDLPENPLLTIRRVLDELVQVDDTHYLGKAHLHWLTGAWQTVAFFCLRFSDGADSLL